MRYSPDFETVKELAATGKYDIVPISCEMLSDILTPIEALRILKNISQHCYILESVAGNEKWGRYTFLGFDPKLEITCIDGSMRIGDINIRTDDPSKQIREILMDYRSPRLDHLPSFTGGLVGYFSFDFLNYAEPTIKADTEDSEHFRDVDLMLFDKVIVFDNYLQKMIFIANMKIGDKAAVETESKTAVTRIERKYIEQQKLSSDNTADLNEADKTADENEADITADLEERKKAAMRRGTVAHKVMELLDYSSINSIEDMDKEIDRITALNFFNDEDRNSLNRNYIRNFYSDDEKSLFRRMKKADEKGLLFREKAFLMGMKPHEIPGLNYKKEDFGDDMITVQGIMDAFFYEINENGEKTITIVDYKTDKVRKPEELVERYSVQLYLYAISLSMITDAKINGIIFYCFPLAAEVDCSEEISKFENKIK